MKKFFSLKLVIVLLIALISSQKVEANVDACVTYDSHRTLEGFKQVILTWKNPFIKGFLWPEYIRLVNNGLEKAGKPLLPSNQEQAIKEIMDNTVEYGYSWYEPSNFENGAKVDGVFEYRDIPGQESPWAVYEKYGIRIMYAKIKCCNPQRPKKEKEVTKTQPAPICPPVAPVVIVEVPTGPSTIINYYGGNGEDTDFRSNRSGRYSSFRSNSYGSGSNFRSNSYGGYENYNYNNYYPRPNFRRGYGNYRSRPEPLLRSQQHYERPEYHREPQRHESRPQKRGPVGAKGYDAVTGSPSGVGGYNANTGGSPSGSGSYSAKSSGGGSYRSNSNSSGKFR